jgi:hypothetical protein
MATNEEPANKLTKLLADGKDIPEMKTNLMSKVQLRFYDVCEMGASYYGLSFLRGIALNDKLAMMSVKEHTRTDQAVEALKAMNIPFGIDSGLQPLDEKRRGRRP